ncbi:MAG TPA: hypothetical protein VMV29_09245 [Ktedonobacterales bacterium]|nr:hypothetical protein [Ktedonobacterales bacterium]
MPDSVKDGPLTLPAPPDIMPGNMTPTAPAGAAPRWPSEVALPFALGVVCAVSWVGAAVLAIWGGLPFAELRAAQAASLLVAPIMIVVVGAALNHDDGRAASAEHGRGRAPVNLALTLAVIVVGLAPAFFAAVPLPPDNNLILLFTLPFAAPGFSLGVALGFAWGARPRPTGAGVGLMGGLGFAAPLVALAALLLVMSRQPPVGCGGKIGCGLQLVLDQLVALLFLASCVLTIALSFIGGILGAYLRRR